MPRKKSDYDIGAEWMREGKPCIHGKGQICLWMESHKECQKCMKEYRKEGKDKTNV